MSQGGYSLFFALSPDEAVREKLYATATWLLKEHRSPNDTSGQRVPAHRLHLTMQHIGEYAQQPNLWSGRLVELAAKVKTAPFEMRMDQAGSFDSNRQIPWWLGPSEAPKEFDQLVLALKNLLDESGIPNLAKKKTKPHLTVMRDAGRGLPTGRPVAPVIWSVREFVLIESYLGQPMAHRVVGTWSLTGTPGSGNVVSPQRDLWDN